MLYNSRGCFAKKMQMNHPRKLWGIQPWLVLSERCKRRGIKYQTVPLEVKKNKDWELNDEAD